MSRSRKMLNMLKIDVEDPELSLSSLNIPAVTKKSENVVVNNDDHITRQTSPLPPDAEEISRQMAGIWEEIVHEDDGTKEMTCETSIPNVISNPSVEDYKNQPNIFSLEVPSSLEELEITQHRSTPVNSELTMLTPMPSPTNVHSYCDTIFCSIHEDCFSVIASSPCSAINSSVVSRSRKRTVTRKTTRNRLRHPKEWADSQTKKMYTPNEWRLLSRWAKNEGEPYAVRNITRNDVFDFKCLVNNKVWMKDIMGKKINWNNIREVYANGSDPNKLYFKYDLTQPDSNILVIRGNTRELKPAYTEPIKIPAAKFKDLMDMCRSKVIPIEYHPYFNSLPRHITVEVSEESEDDASE